MGTRLGETLGIAWRNVDFENGLIEIEQQANFTRKIARLKTQTAYRKIEAPGWLLASLAEIRIGRKEFCEPDDLVFCTSTGKPYSHGNVLGRGLYLACDRAAIDRVSFHNIRHSHASLWIKDGGDVITLSRRLGHANPNVTMNTYASEIEEANDHSVRRARVEALFNGTGMAARMAATEGSTSPQAAVGTVAKVLPLAAGSGTSQ